MPLYDFRCRGCGHVFETLCSSQDKEAGRVPCPECGATDLDRAYSRPAGVVMKAAAPACPSGAMCPNAAACGRAH